MTEGIEPLSGYQILMYLLIGGLVAVPVAYVVARVVGIAWFTAKLAYQRKLIHGLTTGEPDGQSSQKQK